MARWGARPAGRVLVDAGPQWMAPLMAMWLAAGGCGGPKSEPAPEARDRGSLSADEQELVALYGEIAEALTKHGDDCDAMAARVSAAMVAHKSALLRYGERRDRVPYATQLTDRARIEAAMGPRLDRIRKTADQVLPQCSNNRDLGRSLMTLAALTAPRPPGRATPPASASPASPTPASAVPTPGAPTPD